MIKSYTDIPQSQVLSKILSLESADMYYINGDIDKICIGKWGNNVHDEDDIPCWSLAALLVVLPDYTLQTNINGTVFVVCESKKPVISDAYDNPIDACVDMIEKLNELNLL